MATLLFLYKGLGLAIFPDALSQVKYSWLPVTLNISTISLFTIMFTSEGLSLVTNSDVTPVFFTVSHCSTAKYHSAKIKRSIN